MTEKTNQPEKKPSSVEIELLRLRQNFAKLEGFAIETRLMSTLSSHSLPFVLYQFRRVMATAYAKSQSLIDMEKEVSYRFSAYHELSRDSARLREDSRYLNTYLEASLENYRTLADEKTALDGRVHKLEKKVEAQQLIITAVEAIKTHIGQLITKKKLPEDVIADLREIFEQTKPHQLEAIPIPPEEAPEEEETPD